jgi:hypothetical protein
VSIGGNAVINAGQNSVLSSAENWQNLRCEDVLFADFDVLSNCAGGLTQFIDQSSGRAASRRWIFEENEVQPLESNVQTFYSFSQPGDYRVTLQIANESSLDSYSRIVTILPNPMELNQVVFSDGLLVSVKPSATFQWFRNLEPIEGATQRSYRWDGNPGNFAVLTAEGDCNRLSEPFVISSALSESGSAFQLYPNPAHDKVFVTKPWYLSSANIAITDVLGRLIRSEIIRQDVIILDLSDYTSGVYFVTIDALDHRLIYKLVLSK